VAEQIDVWEVVNAEQRAALAKRTLQIRTKMRLRNRSGEARAVVELSLNPGLRITAASAAGKAVSSRRVGELIRLGPLPAAVAAGGEIELELLYTGVPILLREDYELANTITEGDPVSFQQGYVSFADGHALQWMRDSDWLAWPRIPGPHVAGEKHSLQISLDNSDGPFLSSGAISAQTEDKIVYAWEKPPQFLVARGAYRHSSSVEGDIWIGKLSGERTTATARQLLRIRYALGEWLETPSHGSYQAVELPYIPHRRLTLGGMILGFPNDIESRFSSFATTVSSFDSLSGTPPVTPVVKTVHTPVAATELNLAVEVSRAWLSDQIRWPKNELSIAGALRSYSVTCEPPDNTGNQECRRESIGGVNPQAPQGRWTEEAESQSEVTPLRQAFAVVTAYELVLSLAEDQVFIGDEQSKWESVADLYLEGRADTRSLIPPLILQENLPVGTLGKRHNCKLAHFIVALNGFTSQFGRDALADLIAALAQRHPPGGDPLTEEAVQGILQDRFGYDWPATSVASCQ